MNCEICGRDPDTTIILPVKSEKGYLQSFACLECSQSSEHYCNQHEMPHMGFVDETTACRDCIEEIVASQGERVAAAFAIRAQDALVREVAEIYLERIGLGMEFATLGDLPFIEQIGRTNNAGNMARPIITFAQRMKITLEEAVLKACEKPEKVFLGIDYEDRDLEV